MPAKIRWNAANDQMLLVKILETQDLPVDHAKVAAAWSGTPENRPSPRAIKERITKIKENARASVSGDPGLTSPSLRKGRKPAAKKTGVKRKRKATPTPPYEVATSEDGSDIAYDDNLANAEKSKEPERPEKRVIASIEIDYNLDEHEVDTSMHSNDEC